MSALPRAMAGWASLLCLLAAATLWIRLHLGDSAIGAVMTADGLLSPINNALKSLKIEINGTTSPAIAPSPPSPEQGGWPCLPRTPQRSSGPHRG